MVRVCGRPASGLNARVPLKVHLNRHDRSNLPLASNSANASPPVHGYHGVALGSLGKDGRTPSAPWRSDAGAVSLTLAVGHLASNTASP